MISLDDTLLANSASDDGDRKDDDGDMNELPGSVALLLLLLSPAADEYGCDNEAVRLSWIQDMLS